MNITPTMDGDDIDPAPLSVGEDLLVLAERDDLRAQVAALEAERDKAQAERDRLARILAVERGDESQAPEGWRKLENGRWHKRTATEGYAVYEWAGQYVLELYQQGRMVAHGKCKYVLEGMEILETDVSPKETPPTAT